MTRVVVVGSVNLDLSVVVPHLPRAGETVLGSHTTFRPGGKGGNQAVAARRLGAEAVLFAALGEDQFGNHVRAALDAEGVQLTSLVTVSGATTGIAMIVVDGDGENTIVVAPGANQLLDGAQLRALPSVLGPDAVLLLQLEIPLATCLEAARQARRVGTPVLLNAAPLPVLEPDFAVLLKLVDVLVVNEGEALQLIGASAAPPHDLVGWEALADGLRRHGPAACVVTLGSRGAVAADADGTYAQPAFRVHAVDTTGAGDSFCGALAVALAEGLPLPAAVRLGCAAGALAATRMGAQAAIPTRADLDRFLHTHLDE